MHRTLLLMAFIAIFSAYGITYAAPASNPVVNVTSDDSDFDVDDGLCDSDSGTPGEQCSLRAALDNTNADPGIDTITFDAGVFGTPQVITLSSTLSILEDATIDGPGSELLTVSGGGSVRVFTIPFSSAIGTIDIVIDDMTIANGASANGAGVYSYAFTTLRNVRLINNNGSAIYNSLSMSVINSTISGNTAVEGAGIVNIADSSIPSMSVINTTISGNTSSGGAGAILNAGDFTGSLSIVNSTISGNTGVNSGALLQQSGLLSIINSTIADNSATSGASGISLQGGLSTQIKNTILSNDLSLPNCDIVSSLSGSNNLSTDGSCGASFTSVTTSQLNLGPLANNGGATQTHALLTDSAAINAGDNSQLPADIFDADGDSDSGEPLPFDQRGVAFARVVESVVDIGAFEVQIIPAVSNPVVNVTNDGSDFDVDDGLCDTDSVVPGEQCSLRAAIQNTNAAPSPRTITFDGAVFGSPQTITVGSTLPNVTADVTFNGPGANLVTVSGGGTVDIMIINYGTNVTVDGMTFADSSNVGYAAIFSSGSLTLTNTVFNNNRGYNGAIFNNSNSLIITNSSFTNNGYGVGGSYGGAIASSGYLAVTNSTFTANASVDSGAIAAGGVVIITGSTFTNNHAANNGGAIGVGGNLIATNNTFIGNTAGNEGGAIYNANILQSNNNTFSGNSAVNGGAIFNGSSSMEVTNSTLVGNSASVSGGGIYSTHSSIYNTIVAHSPSGGNCSLTGTVNVSNNLSTDGSCGAGFATVSASQLSLSPMLANNGGPTQTYALLESSVAINAGDNSQLSADTLDLDGDSNTAEQIPLDQRGAGYARVVGSVVDIGAFERQDVIASVPDNPVVNVTSDGSETNLYDGVCDSDSGIPGEQCSLRAAIENANGDLDNDTITFDAGAFGTITLTDYLPYLNTNVTIDGPGASQVTVSGGGSWNVFVVDPDINATFEGLTIANGVGVPIATSAGNGGGIYNNLGNVAVSNSVLTGHNAYGYGMAIYNHGGTLMVTNTTFSNNTSTTGYGGGIGINAGMVSVLGSTFSNNSTTSASGIWIETGIVGVYNSTFSNNYGSGGIGAIYAASSATLAAVNNTFVDNFGVAVSSVGTASLYNNLIIGETCNGLAGTINASNNLITEGGCSVAGFTPVVLEFLSVGPLTNNGGLTQTHAIGSGSVAVNAGNNGFIPPDGEDLDGDNNPAEPVPFDQRGMGYDRIFNGTVDVGAFEVQTAAPPPAGFIIEPTSGLVTTEGGGTAQFTVKLATQPTATVRVALSTSDTTEGTVPPSVALNAFNWSTGVTVTVTGVNDNVADGNIAYTIITGTVTSTDTNYSAISGATIPDVSVTNQDNEPSPGIIISQINGLVTTEAGGTATVNFRLSTQPTGNVTIALSSSDTTEGTVPPGVTITTANWQTGTTITITGKDDVLDDGDIAYTIITGTVTTTDVNYANTNPLILPDPNVTNVDNDGAGFVITPTSGLVTTEVGGTATFTIRLTSRPSANVTIALSSSDTTEGTVRSFLTFTPDTWNLARTVLVTGVNDTLADGNIAYSIITGAVTSADSLYSTLDPNTIPDISVTNNDDETSGSAAAVTSISPVGTLTETPVTFNWVGNASSYRLNLLQEVSVEGELQTFALVKNSYEASAVCSNGMCSVQPDIPLIPGVTYVWIVEVVGADGQVIGSAALSFTMPSVTLEPVAPELPELVPVNPVSPDAPGVELPDMVPVVPDDEITLPGTIIGQ